MIPDQRVIQLAGEHGLALSGAGFQGTRHALLQTIRSAVAESVPTTPFHLQLVNEIRDELLAANARAAQLERDIQTLLQMTFGGVRWPEGQDAAAVAYYIAQMRQQNILGVDQLKPGNRYWARCGPPMKWALIDVSHLEGIKYGMKGWEFVGPVLPPTVGTVV
ncbi:hypothetical protein B0T40_10390 [Chromobacterium haemolyticum]|uniref:hypothetical protein n=1 Tax=Chromobacterium haemolyticum TaxID=394935 RepID=UPI0009DB58C4|nr:hypothetical protein [Chromobacterium haemolyticum]OQS36787.1 hypothetical protein B0T40_10390 [Chromobacterium haemolyticum]